MSRATSVVLAWLTLACHSSLEAGLSNARANERQPREQGDHDAIADGPESCKQTSKVAAPHAGPYCPHGEPGHAARRASVR